MLRRTIICFVFLLLRMFPVVMATWPPNPPSHVGDATQMLTAVSKYILSPKQIKNLNVHRHQDHWFHENDPNRRTRRTRFDPFWNIIYENLEIVIGVFFMLLAPVCLEAWSLRSYYPGLGNWYPHTGEIYVCVRCGLRFFYYFYSLYFSIFCS